MGIVLLCTFAFRLQGSTHRSRHWRLMTKDRAALNDLSLEAPTPDKAYIPAGMAAKVVRTPGLAGQTAAKGD